MASIEAIENLSKAFHWASREAALCINESLDTESRDRGTYAAAFEARIFFVSQAVSSAVAIPFILVSSFSRLVWEMGHGEVSEALNTIPAAITTSSYHLFAIFASTFAFCTSMESTKESLGYFPTKEQEGNSRKFMSAIDTIENLSKDFHWATKKAVFCMRQSLNENSCSSELEARIFFAAQAVSSAVAIPFVLISSFFVMLWQIVHCEISEAAYAIPTAIIQSSYHAFTIFASILAIGAPLEWTNKSLDSFQIEHIPHLPINAEV